MFYVYIIVLLPGLSIAGVLYAPSLRAKTESGKSKILWGKLLKYGFVLSGAVALTFIAGIISEGRGSFPAGWGFKVLVIFVSLFLGFFCASTWLWMYPLRTRGLSVYSSPDISRSFLFKKFRTGPAWCMFWAVFFTIPYFVLVSIARARENFTILYPYIALFIIAAAGGVVWGASRLHEMKKGIDGDKVSLPSSYSDELYRGYLRRYLFGVALVVPPGFIATTMLGSTTDIWGAPVLGFFLGASAHRYIWAHLYERRNGVELIHEVAESEQAAESVA
jgi:hypothetical protein